MKMQRYTRRLLANEDGPTVCEYAILLSLIAVVAIGAIRLLGEKMQGVFGLITGIFS
jgi:Flp pilus assembly pilin Flp